ncbi:MAG: ImmA/IrrE family metallo-endopeptidase [Deltaproteobacteria bacterium]|nr:ImmA/IrrE family metallo-endopeptidase [Deltaproteobacteria bacterium]
MGRREDGAYACTKAREIIKKLRIEGVDEIDVDLIAATYNVFVVNGGVTGAEGRLEADNEGGTVRVRSDISKQPRRRRHVIAHELGHYLIHKDRRALAACSERDFTSFSTNKTEEADANWFAAELLMPARLFGPRCDVRQPSLTAIEGLANAFQTPLTTTAIRFVDLAPEPCCIVWSESGRVKWAIAGPEFRGFVERDHQLNSYSVAYDALRDRRGCKEPQEVPARAWLEGGRGDLIEDCWYFSGLDAAVSLLWQPAVDDDERDDDEA